VLRKAGLSDEADPENYLGGSSETMYFIGLDVHNGSRQVFPLTALRLAGGSGAVPVCVRRG
jgi:hypothetical protein